MKKNNLKKSQLGSKRASKNKARMKRRQLEHENMLSFLNKVIKKHGSLYSYEYAKNLREKENNNND